MKKSTVLSIAILMNLIALSQERYTVSENEVLLDGYDPVSYYTGQPEKGRELFQTKYDGRIIYFSSEANRKEFLAAPDHFMPEYGGWCSYSMARNQFVFPDYTMYKIQDGELLFFAVKAFFNGKTAWEKNPEIHKISADKYYFSYFPE